MFLLFFHIMAFEKINCVDQHFSHKHFDIKQFNKNFEDSMLLSKINTSEAVIYEYPSNTVAGHYNKVQIDADIIDRNLIKGRNFFDPRKPNFIDPNTNSKNRLLIICLVDKFTKSIFVMLNNKRYRYWLPGGRPKIIEPAIKGILRIFKSISGLSLEEKKVRHIYKTGHIDVFLTYHFDKSKILRTSDTAWVPLEYLRYYQNEEYKTLYNIIYLKIMNSLY